MYIGCLCKLQATTHFLYSVCANSRPPLYLLACANSRLVSTYLFLSYLFPSPTTIIRQLPAFSPQHQVNTRPDPLHNSNQQAVPAPNVLIDVLVKSMALKAEQSSDLHEIANVFIFTLYYHHANFFFLVQQRSRKWICYYGAGHIGQSVSTAK